MDPDLPLPQQGCQAALEERHKIAASAKGVDFALFNIPASQP
jgi:hypothetical protein